MLDVSASIGISFVFVLGSEYICKKCRSFGQLPL